MPDSTWQIYPGDLSDDEALTTSVLDIHQAILQGQMMADPMVNLNLPIQLRALRQIDGWRALLLLTPWMLSRLLFPNTPPSLKIPEDWSAANRQGADYLLLGPRLDFELLRQPQRAHLNFHPRLGHYLLQPICLRMESYSDPEAVFEEWNQVIRTRDENMEKAKRDCPLQKEISRRELFRHLRPSGE